MRAETLTIIWPHAGLIDMNAERKMHHHQRARLVKPIRAEAKATAADLEPFPGPVTIAARFQWPTRHVRDSSNWFPTLKAAVDGLTDAGLLPKDDDRTVRNTSIGVDLPPNPKLAGYARLTITITEVAE